MTAENKPFCVSAYDDFETHARGGKSHDSEFRTKDEATAAFQRLVSGRRFYAVALGYRGATGDYQDLDEWTQGDD